MSTPISCIFALIVYGIFVPRATLGQEPQALVSFKDAKGLLEAAKSIALNEKGELACQADSIPTKIPIGLTVPTEVDGRIVPAKALFFTSYKCSHETGKPDLLFHLLAQNKTLNQTIPILRNQFFELGGRLEKLQNERNRLREKFTGYSLDFLKPIDQDILRLSMIGMDLADVTKRFYDAAEPRLIDLEQKRDVLAARQQALAGLRDFTADIDQANRMASEASADQSFADIIAQLDKAVRELERSIGDGDKEP